MNTEEEHTVEANMGASQLNSGITVDIRNEDKGME